ncbi:MAG TPA: hypothetical protein VHL80_01785 [Polyangia bacterium]|nr:hypothetical protein [Polyangia bacterium]
MTAPPMQLGQPALVPGHRLHLPPADPREAAPLPFDLVLVGAGVNVAVRSFWRRLFGWKRHRGRAPDICAAVVEDCWTGDFFAGSAGHFKQFWTRDLAMCTPALCRLGHRDRVVRSWAWGLERFERAGRITTTIFNGRFARDVYAYGVDSLPMLLWGLQRAGAQHLVEQHRPLLTREIQRFHDLVFDPQLGMARAEGYFSGPRDCMTGRSTVFANTMIALCGRLTEELGLPNPFRSQDVVGAMWQHHWMGDHFRDSLCRDIPSGDANVWPFFFEVVADRQMQRRALATLDERGYTRPLPLRYFPTRLPEAELPVPRAATPNYQGDPSWMQLGAAYLKVLGQVDRPLMEWHRANVARFIERDGSYLEVYATDGKPYQGRALLYSCDEGMLWAAMFLDLY